MEDDSNIHDANDSTGCKELNSLPNCENDESQNDHHLYRDILPSGVLYISFNKEEINKTDPSQFKEWFSPDYISKNKLYAILEEKPYFLKLFTHIHEVKNKFIRKRGSKKVVFMGQEVFGNMLFACGHCGYRSSEGGNVKRHLRMSVCLKERGYSKNDLVGLSRVERKKFLKRIASAKFRAKQKTNVANGLNENDPHCVPSDSCLSQPQNTETDPTMAPPSPLRTSLAENYSSELDSSDCYNTETSNLSISLPSNFKQSKKVSNNVLTLGPHVEYDVVRKIAFDVYTVNDSKMRVAWRPVICHKAGQALKEMCHIVFKGARMRRRCLDLPLPLILVYRKLECRVHHCNFTLFHPHARKAISEDVNAQLSVNVRMYGETVMTHEFYQYFVSLLSVMKMKSSQTARHLTRVWESVLLERLKSNSLLEEHRKMVTLSKQTVKAIWSSIAEETGKTSSSHRIVPACRNTKKKNMNLKRQSTSSHPPDEGVPHNNLNHIITSEEMHQQQPPTISTTIQGGATPVTTLQHHQMNPPPHLPHPYVDNSQQQCAKIFPAPFPKATSSTQPSNITIAPLSHAAGVLQPSTPWFGQGHPQCLHNISYPVHHVPSHSIPDEYYVQTPFTT